MLRLVYTSQAIHPFTPEDLFSLLNLAKERNRAADITGLLLYKDGEFLQVLEGDDEAVQSLYQGICRDPRHHHIRLLDLQPIARREFPHWSMGFRRLDAPAASHDPAFAPLVSHGLEFKSMTPLRAYHLLSVIRHGHHETVPSS